MVAGPEQMGHEAEVEQLGVGGPVVVLLLLHPGVFHVVDGGGTGIGGGHHLGHLEHREGLGELVEDPVLARVGGVEQGQLHTGQGVSDVEHAPGLAPLAVDREGMAHHGLDAEPVEHGPEHGVVVEARGQVGVHGGLVGLLAVDHALVEVGHGRRPQMRQAKCMLWLSCTLERW